MLLNKIDKNLLWLFLLGTLFLLNGCGSDRAGSTAVSEESNMSISATPIPTVIPSSRPTDVLGESKKDTDNDGLTDDYETNISHTNPYSPDTDGDCLLDSYEINYYETNATNRDTDGDGIPDGIEIYSYVLGETNDTCLLTPEILSVPYNQNPAIDNLQSPDIINALDSRVGEKDSDGDGISDKDEKEKYGTNPFSSDSDGDGLNDGDEINIYHTNPLNPDSDNDGLNDGDEVHHSIEPTNPLEKDSDNDGLEDKFEVNSDELNATNPDTDGDCLLDSFEVNDYKTKPNDKDTDNDGVDDGMEIYGDINTSCLGTPETLNTGKNSSPAQDNIPEPDMIDALDPTNDSDKDGQANIQELNCTEGNPKDKDKLCPYITTGEGLTLSEYGFAYIPGGFDVDRDGVNEGGFWASTYQARDSGDSVVDSEVMALMEDGYLQFIKDKFQLLAGNIAGYTEDILDSRYLEVPELVFKEEIVKKEVRYTEASPYTLMASLNSYKLKNNSGDVLDVKLKLMTLKQYTHIKMLLNADKENGGDGTHIRNGLLGIDVHVPLDTYSLIMQEFGNGYREYTSTLVQLRENTNSSVQFTINDIEEWWDVNKENILRNIDSSGNQDGAYDRIDVGFSAGPTKDDYAILSLAGKSLDIRQGTAGINQDSTGTTNGIGVRAVTDYLY